MSAMAALILGEIVHGIDLKDGKFGRDEAEGIKSLIAGICSSTDDDAKRLARGAAVFEDLHTYFSRKKARSDSA
jgi:hypothetical protein